MGTPYLLIKFIDVCDRAYRRPIHGMFVFKLPLNPQTVFHNSA